MRPLLLLLAAAAWATEPLTSGQKTALGWSDQRPLKEKAAHLHQLQREAQSLGKEAPPLLARLAALAPRYGDGTAEAERAELRGAVHELRRRALLLDEEYSIMRRAYEYDRGLALLGGALKKKKAVPRRDLANIAALNSFHDGIRRLVRRLPEALARDEAAFQEAAERERLARRRRTLTLSVAAVLGALLLLRLARARLTKA